MSTRPTIDDVREIGDVQQTYKWNMIFTELPKKGTYPSKEALNVRCTTTEIPTAQIDNVSITTHGHTVHQSGNLHYNGTLTMNFIEDITNTMRKFLKEWRENTRQTITGKGSKKSDIEATITLETLDNEDTPNWTIVLTGCQYRNSPLGGLESGTSSNAMAPGLTVAYDYFEDNEASG